MDFITGWLSHRYDGGHTNHDWHSIIFYTIVVIAVVLATIGAVRRRDRASTAFCVGLLLLFIGNPIRDFGLMLFVRDPTQYPSFFAYVEAQRPWVQWGIVNRNVIEPVGFVLALVGAIALADYGRRRRAVADSAPQAPEANTDLRQV